MRLGGYEDGYKTCDCFWGTSPGSLMPEALKMLSIDDKTRALDAGCGEGKNASYLAKQGAHVTAIDVSSKAIEKGKRLWADLLNIHWVNDDVSNLSFSPNSLDIIVAYGFYHCLSSEKELGLTIEKLQNATKTDGVHVICAFNKRLQELDAHPGFSPLLIDHSTYLSLYKDWEIKLATDEDLHESHPHNNIWHTHSMTRLIARKK